MGLEIFRVDADMLKPKVVHPFYKETMYVWKNLSKRYVVSGVKSKANNTVSLPMDRE